jgi:hypothetical protein
MARLAEALGRASPKFDESRLMPFGMRAMSDEGDLPSSFLHRGELTLFCRHSDLKKDSSHVNAGCNSDLQVRDALRTYLKMPQLPMAVSCDVVPERITGVLKEFLNFDWDNHNTPSVYSEDPTCNGWTKCTVSSSVQDPELAKTIEQVRPMNLHTHRQAYAGQFYALEQGYMARFRGENAGQGWALGSWTSRLERYVLLTFLTCSME